MTAEILGTTVGFSHHSSKGVDWVFVEHGSYDRAGGLYGDENGVYGDNQVCVHQKFATTATRLMRKSRHKYNRENQICYNTVIVWQHIQLMVAPVHHCRTAATMC